MCWGWLGQCGWHDAMVISTPGVSKEVVLAVVATWVLTWVFSTPVLSTMVTPVAMSTQVTPPGWGPLRQLGLHYGGFQLDGLDCGGVKRGCVDVMVVSSLGTPWVAGQRCQGWAVLLGVPTRVNFGPGGVYSFTGVTCGSALSRPLSPGTLPGGLRPGAGKSAAAFLGA